eukprot:8952376-Pyramimonas_sp.AAC.1
MDQSDAGIAGIFSRWTNQTQETRVYSHDGPIRRSSESHSRASVRVPKVEFTFGMITFSQPIAARSSSTWGSSVKKAQQQTRGGMQWREFWRWRLTLHTLECLGLGRVQGIQ